MGRKHSNEKAVHTSQSIISPGINPIKMKPQEIACESAEWMKQAQDIFQWHDPLTIVYKLRVP
jgi:hypothetical protein